MGGSRVEAILDAMKYPGRKLHEEVINSEIEITCSTEKGQGIDIALDEVFRN